MEQNENIWKLVPPKKYFQFLPKRIERKLFQNNPSFHKVYISFTHFIVILSYASAFIFLFYFLHYTLDLSLLFSLGIVIPIVLVKLHIGYKGALKDRVIIIFHYYTDCILNGLTHDESMLETINRFYILNPDYAQICTTAYYQQVKGQYSSYVHSDILELFDLVLAIHFTSTPKTFAFDERSDQRAYLKYFKGILKNYHRDGEKIISNIKSMHI